MLVLLGQYFKLLKESNHGLLSQLLFLSYLLSMSLHIFSTRCFYNVCQWTSMDTVVIHQLYD